MSERVRITDVSPRDGLQNEPGVIPTAEKVRLVELLCATGVDEVEVTSFVSRKWVPQLGDAGEVFRGLLSPSQREGLGVGSLDARPEARAPSTTTRFRPPARNALTLHRAQTLRRTMTGPEQELWSYLRRAEWMGAKFRRQHPFGPYILDFFCQEKLLCVEVDGQTHVHELAQVHDGEREEYLRGFGIEVLRFSNDEVVANPAGVAERIRRLLRVRPSLGSRKPTPQPPPSGRGSGAAPPVLSALVPNERGMQAVLDVNRDAGRKLIDKIAVFTAASETFSRRNTNASIDETLERFRPVISMAHAEGIQVRGYISCVIACPFEGAIAPGMVVDVAKRLLELRVSDIDLGDTIGAGTRESVAALLREYVREVPILGGRALTTLHLHDTLGRAAECVRAALELGVRSFDGSVAGLGGCPYASTPGKRAPGNISTEVLVRTVEEAGFETGVDAGRLAEAAAYAREIVGRSRAAAQPGGGA